MDELRVEIDVAEEDGSAVIILDNDAQGRRVTLTFDGMYAGPTIVCVTTDGVEGLGRSIADALIWLRS